MNTVRLVFACASLGVLAACGTPPVKEVISTKDAPAAIGPYSQGIRNGHLVFLAGQGPTDAKTGKFAGPTIEDQTRQAIENLRAVLATSGMTLDDVVSTTVYMKDIEDFARMNAVYGTYFKEKPPARATVQVARLPKDSLIQISAVAAK